MPSGFSKWFTVEVFAAWGADWKDNLQNSTWSNITTDIRRVSIQREKAGPCQGFLPGRLKVTADNNTQQFDPTYGSNKAGSTLNLRPGTPIRVQLQGTNIYTGFVTGFNQRWDTKGVDATCDIGAVDGLAMLTANTISSTYAEQLCNLTVDDILDSAGWSTATGSTGMRIVETTTAWTPMKKLRGHQTPAVNMLKTANLAEAGWFYVDASGRFRWLDRYYYRNHVTGTTYTFTNRRPYGSNTFEYQGLKLCWDDQTIWNGAEYLRRGQTAPQTASDSTSQTRYGERTLTAYGIPQKQNSATLALANLSVARWRTPTYRGTVTIANPSSTALRDRFTPDFDTNETWKIEYKGGGGNVNTVTGSVHGITYEFGADGAVGRFEVYPHSILKTSSSDI